MRYLGVISSGIASLAIVALLGACRGDTPSAGDPRITAEHYANAEKWIKTNALARVKNLLVKPQWIDGEGHRFWYRRETAQGHEFTVVDAATADKASAFDHAALAKELVRLGEQDVDAQKLDLSDLEISKGLSRLDFSLKTQRYQCEGHPLVCTKTADGMSSPGVLRSPDGRLGLETRDANLFLLDLSSGARKALTRDGEPHFGYGLYYGNWDASYIPNERAGKPRTPMGAQWSPGSKYVLVTRLDERHVAEYPFMESSPADGSFRPKVHLPRIPLTGEEPAKLEWFVIDIASGRKVPLALPYDKLLYLHQDWTALAEAWWSETEGKLYTVAYGDNRGSAFFFEVDLKSGQVRTLIEERMSPRMDLNSTPYNPPNVKWLPRSREVIWFSQRSGWGHLYLHDGRTGALKHPITQGEWLVRDIVAVDEPRRLVYFTASSVRANGKEPGDPYRRDLYRVSLDGGEPTRLTPEDADHMVTTPSNPVWPPSDAEAYTVLSPDGRYAVYNYSRIDEPTKTAIVPTDGGTPKVFESADASALYAAGWRNPEAFVVKAADGKTDLHGVLYLPASLDSKLRKAYPIVDREYASPLTAVVPHNFMTAIQGPSGRIEAASVAELGFAVVAIDARGTPFRSKAFSHYSDGNLDTDGLEDHVAAIRQLAERHPWMDIDRVGIDGASYGGFAVFRAMFELGDFFKVGVSSVGTGSVSSMYPDSHWEAYHGRVRYENGSVLKSRPQDRPVNYLNNDNALQAKNLKGKLLITLGELDENVLPGSTLQVVDALIRADKDFDMYYFPNEPHRFRNAFSTRRIWDYLVENLHGQTPPRYHIQSLK